MEKEFIVKRCEKCGAIVRVLKDCKCPDCGIQCCGAEMKTLIPNSVDAAIEKHVPTYEVVGDKINVKVNHVMEEDHFIEWICMVADQKECMHLLTAGKPAECHFRYVSGAILYAYCNKHGLWKVEVK